jgi:hypothetical protein
MLLLLLLQQWGREGKKREDDARLPHGRSFVFCVSWRIGWLLLFRRHHACNSKLRSDREYLSVNGMTYFLLWVPTSCPYEGRSRVGVQLGVQWVCEWMWSVESVWCVVGVRLSVPPLRRVAGSTRNSKWYGTLRPVDDNCRARPTTLLLLLGSCGRAATSTHCLSTLDQQTNK